MNPEIQSAGLEQQFTDHSDNMKRMQAENEVSLIYNSN